MKILTVFAALFLSLSAQARTPIYSQQETLSRVMIDGRDTAYTALLNLDFVNSEITVEILDSKKNDKLIYTLEAPMDKRYLSCGSSIYSGEKDMRPVDGMHTIIKVSDHNHRMCRDLVPALIEVKASIRGPFSRRSTQFYLLK